MMTTIMVRHLTVIQNGTKLVGPSAFSEPEETSLALYIKSRGNVQGYIDFHSYSQLWMTVR
jgi:hypothetical protein